MSAKALAAAVARVDGEGPVRRIAPIAFLVEVGEPELALDAHLCFTPGVAGRLDERGFRARGCAYLALLLPHEKRLHLFDAVMSLDDIVAHGRTADVTPFERRRAAIFDAVQGGGRAALLESRVHRRTT